MNRSQKENQMNKLIFTSLLSVGAILAAQTPAAQAPASPSKTTASKAKTSKKHHSKKATAVNSKSAKPAAK
jgi:hypothetical protein